MSIKNTGEYTFETDIGIVDLTSTHTQRVTFDNKTNTIKVNLNFYVKQICY
jgi:hypothetical protein